MAVECEIRWTKEMKKMNRKSANQPRCGTREINLSVILVLFPNKCLPAAGTYQKMYDMDINNLDALSIGLESLYDLVFNGKKQRLTLASVTLNSLRMYWGMLYSAMGSTTKYWYLAERSAGQYWWHFSCEGEQQSKTEN